MKFVTVVNNPAALFVMLALMAALPFSSTALAADNGTITIDGLVYAKTINCFGRLGWDDAMRNASQLASGSCGLSDGSKAGQWRLPTLNEVISAGKMTGFVNNPSWPQECFWTAKTEPLAPDYADCAERGYMVLATSKKSNYQNVLFVRAK